MTVVEMLDRLADMQAQMGVLQAHFDQLRDEIIPSEVQMQLIELDAERQTALESIQGGIASLETEIRSGVLETGISVKGAKLHAIWSKGRVSWDTKSLDGYVIAHPELTAFRKEGDPSVSIRKI